MWPCTGSLVSVGNRVAGFKVETAFRATLELYIQENVYLRPRTVNQQKPPSKEYKSLGTTGWLSSTIWLIALKSCTRQCVLALDFGTYKISMLYGNQQASSRSKTRNMANRETIQLVPWVSTVFTPEIFNLGQILMYRQCCPCPGLSPTQGSSLTL